LEATDEKIVQEALTIAQDVSRHIEKFRLDLAADIAYHFVWDRFAAEILEESKPILKGSDAAARQSRAAALYEPLVRKVQEQALRPKNIPEAPESLQTPSPTADTVVSAGTPVVEPEEVVFQAVGEAATDARAADVAPGEPATPTASADATEESMFTEGPDDAPPPITSPQSS